MSLSAASHKLRVAINGYGTIGRRVADAVAAQPDMEVVGVSKLRPDYKTGFVEYRGFPLYGDNPDSVVALRQAGYRARGTLEDLLAQAEVVVDCTPPRRAVGNRPRYHAAGVKQVYQGGENAAVAPISFNAQVNFDAARGLSAVRVVSCNTTGMTRVLHGLQQHFGVRKARIVIARKATDPDDPFTGPVDGAVLDPAPAHLPAHHGADVAEVLPNLAVFAMSARMPMTHAHFHSLIVSLATRPDREQVVAALAGIGRTLLLDSRQGIASTMQVFDIGRELGRSRGDLYEGCLWEDSVVVEDDELYCFMAVHQEAIVIPETVDAIRALGGNLSQAESLAVTNATLGIVHGRLTDILRRPRQAAPTLAR